MLESAQALIDRAIALHGAGNYLGAEEIYRQILAADPRQPVALHLLGVLRSQTGDKDKGVELITRAIAINPRVPDFHANLALAYIEKGDPQPAIAAARAALALDPRNVDALNHMGSGLRMMGRF